MDQNTQTENTLSEFTTNGFSENPLPTIAMATVAGMSLMFITISLNASIITTMVGLFAGILLVYGFKVASITYTLTDEGVRQRIRKFLPYKINKKESVRFIAWSDISSFKNDWDRNRSGADYEFLKIYLTKSPKEIWITNQSDVQGFNHFKESFMQSVEVGKSKPVSQANSANTVKQNTSHIKQRKSFYDTWFAKFLTIFFGLWVIAIFIFAEINGIRFSTQLKFQAVMVPGTVYMFYRVFIKKKN